MISYFCILVYSPAIPILVNIFHTTFKYSKILFIIYYKLDNRIFTRTESNSDLGLC